MTGVSPVTFVCDAAETGETVSRFRLRMSANRG